MEHEYVTFIGRIVAAKSVPDECHVSFLPKSLLLARNKLPCRENPVRYQEQLQNLPAPRNELPGSKKLIQNLAA